MLAAREQTRRDGLAGASNRPGCGVEFQPELPRCGASRVTLLPTSLARPMPASQMQNAVAAKPAGGEEKIISGQV